MAAPTSLSIAQGTQQPEQAVSRKVLEVIAAELDRLASEGKP